jgi:phenylalanine-4-hydroxylase
VFSVEGRSPNRIHLNVDRVMRTDYTISDLQATYFVIESFRELFHLTEQRGFEPIYESLAPGFQYAKTAALDTDHIYHRGTQEYELRGGRGSGARPV